MGAPATRNVPWLLRLAVVVSAACGASGPPVWQAEADLDDLRRALAAGADPNDVFHKNYVMQVEVPSALQSYLSLAAGCGSIALVRELVAAGADVNRRDTTCDPGVACNARTAGYGWTPLMYAVAARTPEVVDFLLAHGADVTAAAPDGSSVLNLAACDQAMVERLLAHGAPLTTPPGTRSALERTFDPPWDNRRSRETAQRCQRVALRLLAAGAELSTIEPAAAQCFAARVGQLELLRALAAKYGLPPSAATQALSCAVAVDELETSAWLLAHGADVHGLDEAGRTMLARAAGGPARAVSMLVAHGAELDAVGKNGETALIYAASWDGIEAARALLDQGAAVDARGRGGLTALHIAAAEKTQGTRVLELLIARGAAIDALDDAGRTPLFHALHAGNAYAAHLLVAAGADVRIRDHAGADLSAARAEAYPIRAKYCDHYPAHAAMRVAYLPNCPCSAEDAPSCCWFGAEITCVAGRWVSRRAAACPALEPPTCKPPPSR